MTSGWSLTVLNINSWHFLAFQCIRLPCSQEYNEIGTRVTNRHHSNVPVTCRCQPVKCFEAGWSSIRHLDCRCKWATLRASKWSPCLGCRSHPPDKSGPFLCCGASVSKNRHDFCLLKMSSPARTRNYLESIPAGRKRWSYKRVILNLLYQSCLLGEM